MMPQGQPGGPQWPEAAAQAGGPVSPFSLMEELGSLTPLVKEGLRLAIQSKRAAQGLGPADTGAGPSLGPAVGSVERPRPYPTRPPVSAEEEERRQRRRERNKMAAAKCRNKKRERTECLQRESEQLEALNTELRSQMEALRRERQQLVFLLNLHRPTCIVRARHGGHTPEEERALLLHALADK
ncbi:unnamed protein product [Lampetra fluviatilis]